MIDETLIFLNDRLLKEALDWLRNNGYHNVDKVCFRADGLKDGMKYGIGCPSIDNSISIYDDKGNRLGEYL